jgi:hypothetical protein
MMRFLLLLSVTTFAIGAPSSVPFFASSDSPIPSQNPQNPPDNTLKINAKLVPIRVVVRDSNGHAVSSLTKDDFQVFDNGKPQAISQFFTEQPLAAPAPVPATKRRLNRNRQPTQKNQRAKFSRSISLTTCTSSRPT